MLDISVIGPVAVRSDGAPIAVPAGRTAELLVRLAVDANQVVGADRLLDDLWDDDPAARRNTLQSKVVKLRRALGDASAIESVGAGYRLRVDGITVRTDLVEVDQALVLAVERGDAGDDTGVVDVCATARAAFLGDVLPTAGDRSWVAPHRSRLDAALVRLVELEHAARLRLGRAGEVVDGLEPYVVSHPYHESLWELLVTALYRTGRQADALSALQRVRRMLADDLGLDPGPALQALERQVLTHDPALGDVTSVAGIARSGNLPTLTTELVGRDDDLCTVVDLVDRQPLVELVGPGGIGKTALAIAVARACSAPGGVWLVRLDSAADDEVVDRTISALGVVGGAAALTDRLRAQPTMLVLDNCEHVVDAAAELVQAILDAAPRTRVLCTSQVSLGLDGAATYDVAPLPIDHSVALFERRAAAHRRRSGHADERSAVRVVCESLDGLPLAIELAAARTRTLTVSEIGRRLDRRFDLLHDPTSRRPERRRALRATIGWSYDLLFADDQRGLWALSVCPGGATIAVVEQILDALGVPQATAADVVSRLAARSLLLVDDTGRFRLLDSIRAFALEALDEAGEDLAAHQAHADWLAGHAAASTSGVRGADQASFLDLAHAERADIDAALHWTAAHDPALGVRIANGFGWAWVVLGDSRGALRIRRALDVAGDAVTPRDRASGLLLIGWSTASLGDLGAATEAIVEARSIADDLDDDELRARADHHLAYVVSHEGRWDDALAYTDRCRRLLDRLDLPWDRAANELFALRAVISAGDRAGAASAAGRAAEAVRAVDDPWLHVRLEAMLGELARLERRFDDAVRHLAGALAVSQRRGYRQTEAYQVASLGRAQWQAGELVPGVDTLGLAVAKAEATGDVRMAALARVHLGRVRRALGDVVGAREALERASDWHRSHGGAGEQVVLGEVLLAALDAGDARPGAVDRLDLLLHRAEVEGNVPAQVLALDALARATAEGGDEQSARSLAARADELMPRADHFVTGRDRVDALPHAPAVLP